MLSQRIPLFLGMVVVLTLSASSTHSQAPPLVVPFYGTSAGGFSSAARGWNSWALQANPNAILPSFQFNQESVLRQCSALRPIDGHDTYCSLDSGWSAGSDGDEYGRLIPDSNFPDISGLADELHSRGLKLGVYALPGAFNNDQEKTVLGTNIKIGDLFNRTEDPSGQTCNNYLARSNFDFTKDGVRQWHESVVDQFASWGVDFIKLDFVTPGSPDGGCMPEDSSQSVKFYRDAIANNGREMRLDISWKLDRRDPYWELWRGNADSVRTDQDINNSGQLVLADWEVVQRAINHYRMFIVEQVAKGATEPIMIRPDMDNSMIGNGILISGVTNLQRYTVATHWIGAGANLITGSDMTRLDALGEQLLWDEELMKVADFCAEYPMQPRNPEESSQPGGNEASQLQSWIAGPDRNGEAIVIQSNYGPDRGQGGFGTQLRGTQQVSNSLASLGIAEGMQNGGRVWSVTKLWGVSADPIGPWNITADTMLETLLDEGESALFTFKRLE